MISLLDGLHSTSIRWDVRGKTWLVPVSSGNKNTPPRTCSRGKSVTEKTDQPTRPGQFLQTVSEWPLGPLVSSEEREAPVLWFVFLRSFVERKTRAASKAYPDHTANQIVTRSALWPTPRPSSPSSLAV